MAELINYEPADIEIYLKEKGMVLQDKSLIAFTKSDGKILAVGKEAELVAGKNIADVRVMSPLRQGMIVDYLAAVRMFQYMMTKIWKKRLFYKPYIAVCTSKCITEVAKKALEDAWYETGAKEVTVYEGDLERFAEEMKEYHAKQYASYDIFISIFKNEPEKYIAEELSDILKYAVQQGIPAARVEELLKKEKERI